MSKSQMLQDTLAAVSTMTAAELAEIGFQTIEMVREGKITTREANAITKAADARRKALRGR